MMEEKTMHTFGSQSQLVDQMWAGEKKDLAEYPGMCYCHFQPIVGLIKEKQDGVVRAQESGLISIIVHFQHLLDI